MPICLRLCVKSFFNAKAQSRKAQSCFLTGYWSGRSGRRDVGYLVGLAHAVKKASTLFVIVSGVFLAAVFQCAGVWEENVPSDSRTKKWGYPGPLWDIRREKLRFLFSLAEIDFDTTKLGWRKSATLDWFSKNFVEVVTPFAPFAAKHRVRIRC